MMFGATLLLIAAQSSPRDLVASSEPVQQRGAAEDQFAGDQQAPSVVPNPAPLDGKQTRVPATPTATAYPAEAAGDPPLSGDYAPARWAEDWRRMRDPRKRNDPLDRLKYLPLTGDGAVYLTLSGEARVRMNLTTNPGLLEVQAQRQDIYRLFAGADLHLGEHVRVYGELARGVIGGANIGTPAGTLRNDLLVQQMFVDVSDRVGDVTLGARVGRQEFVDGPNLLLANRDNNTIHFTLNGMRGWARGARVRADVFDFRYTTLGNGGIGDDPIDNGRRFSGLTSGVVLPRSWLDGSELYLDPFLWRLRNRQASWGSVAAREERIYAGAHLWGEAGPLTVDWTVNHQGGSFDNRPIDAWQLFFAQTYRLGQGGGAPRVGFHADYATGGGSGGGTLRNALAPFGNNIYYSYGLFLTPTNLVAVAPNVTFTPLKRLRATMEYQWAWRADVNEPVYRANGTAYAGTGLFDARKIADVARLQLVWTATPRLSFTLRLERFLAGPALSDAGFRNSSFVGAWINARF